MAYEYEAAAEESYRSSLIKSFKKQVDDGFFPFIIVDCINDKVRHFAAIAAYAKINDFEVNIMIFFSYQNIVEYHKMELQFCQNTIW